MNVRALQERFYPGKDLFGFTSVDGTLPFLLRVHSLVRPGGRLLDFGAGRGAYGEINAGAVRALSIFRNFNVRVIGVDVDAAVLQNPYLDEALLISNDGR